MPSMTLAPYPDTLSINTQHVQHQFARRGDLASAEFIYGEIANRMLDRLKLVRLDPKDVLDAGCGSGRRLMMLRQRYPSANIIGLDHNPLLLAMARQSIQGSWWQPLMSVMRRQPKTELVQADLAQTGLAPESIDLIWSNLAIHWHAEPHEVLREWSRVLRPNGLAFFSGWGPSTGQELRAAIAAAQLKTQPLPLVDMHDLGDLMIEQGFADPVMDQETITLTYDSAQAMLIDVRALGGNPNPLRKRSLASRQWHQRLLEALESARRSDGKLTLTLEIAYGHAWRSAIRRSATETRISVQSIQRKTTD
jgi:malonyl-CoA O-methyltransferase